MPHAYKRTAKKNLFFLLEKIRKEPIQVALIELFHNQESGCQYLRDIQNEKLKSLLTHCFNNIEFYNVLYGRAGVSSAQIQTVEDLKKLPTITKADVRGNIEGLKSCSGPSLFSVKTSGSTGSPLKFYKDRTASAYSYAAMYRGLGWHGIDICEREAYLWGIPITRKERGVARLRDFVLNRFREKKFNMSDDVFADFYKKMKRRKPGLLSGYSTFLYEFSCFIKRNGLDVASIRPKIVKYTAEMMYEFQRECIEQVFECPVVGEYGSAEIGVMAFQCANRNYHVISDCCVLEFEAREDEGLYEIVATNLNARGFPLVRYRTGDLVETPGFSYCSCGLPFPVMGPMIGRSADMVITPEGKKIHCNIFSYIIKYLLEKNYDIEQLLFVQESTSLLTIKVPPAFYGNKNLEKEISDVIYERISPMLKVSYEKLIAEDKIRKGKLRYFISKITASHNETESDKR